MDRDNISALTMAIVVVAIIVGFGVYFNSPTRKGCFICYYNKWRNQNNKA